MRSFLAFAFVSILASCSGASDNPFMGGGTGDGGGGGADGGGGGGDSGLGPCDAKCGVNVPNGFKLVVATTDRMTACPQGWTSHDVVGPAMLADGACSCACNVTQQPDCSTGTLQRSTDYLTNPSCNQPATTITVSKQGCSQLPNAIYAQGLHYSAALTPNGGTCSWDTKSDPQKLTTRDARTCDVPDSCQGAVCGAKNVCVVTDGDLACPPTFPNKTLIGASASVECSACSACTLEASCTGTLSMYTDTNCTTAKTDYPADGSCNKNPGQNFTFYSYQFQGSLGKAGCGGATPTSTGSLKLAQPQTLCCQQK